jgi:hypothetical protein
MKRALVLCSWVVLPLSGCLGPVDLFDSKTAVGPAPTTFDDRDWATVLRENVKNGLVDYAHLQEHAEPLERYLATLARVGPVSTPDLFDSGPARLAYYLNAYNAGVLAAVLHEQAPPTMHDVRRRRLEHAYRLLVDAKPQTLADLRQAARTQSPGDARVEFCLCNAALGSPPLQNRPFRADTLDRDLRRVAREAMDNPRIVSVDHERERLNVALVIHQRRAEFLDSHRRQTGTKSPTLLSALLHLADGVRREWLNTAVGYSEGVIPFDRSLNRWTAATAASP